MSLQIIAIYDRYSLFSVPDVRELNQQPMNQYPMNSFFTLFNSYNLSWKRSIKTCTLPRNGCGFTPFIIFIKVNADFYRIFRKEYRLSTKRSVKMGFLWIFFWRGGYGFFFLLLGFFVVVILLLVLVFGCFFLVGGFFGVVDFM